LIPDRSYPTYSPGVAAMQALFKPVTATISTLGGGAIARTGARRLTKYDSAFQAELSRCKETGEDMATTTYARWGALTLVTIPHRAMKLAKEATYIPDLIQVWTWSAADFVVFARFLVRLAFVFLFFKIIGRDSPLHIVGPKSIYWADAGPVDVSAAEKRATSVAAFSEPIASIGRTIFAPLAK